MRPRYWARSVVQALEKLVDDKGTDEVHVIDPLVTQARWALRTRVRVALFIERDPTAC